MGGREHEQQGEVREQNGRGRFVRLGQQVARSGPPYRLLQNTCALSVRLPVYR